MSGPAPLPPPAIRDADRGWRALPLRPMLTLLACYWAGVFAVGTLWMVLLGRDPFAFLWERALATGFGATMAAAMALALFRLRHGRFVRQAVCGLAMAVIGALAYKAFSGIVFHEMIGWPTEPALREAFAQSLFYWTATFFGWATLAIALHYNLAVRERERRLTQLRSEAYEAQMRALHYQINPHFLFNTMNSVAGLIERDDREAALLMVTRLGEFLRTTLDLDPLADLTLAEEFTLQATYLAIEEQRFSDRVTCTTSLPPALRDAPVPSLILQPLVENAIKHGLARSTGPVRIDVRAHSEDGRLVLEVENDCPPAVPAAARQGVGLRNVGARIASRFGDAGSMTSGRIADAVWCSRIVIPLTGA